MPTTELKARWEQVALGDLHRRAAAGVLAARLRALGHGAEPGSTSSSRSSSTSSRCYGITVGFHRLLHARLVQGQPRRCASRSRSPAAWRSRARSPAGSPTTAGTTRSATRRATRTRPWRYGDGFTALCKGLWHAHIGWLFDVEQTDQKRFAPDLLADKDIARVTQALPVRSSPSRCSLPALLGGLITGAWHGRAHRVLLGQRSSASALLHHVTWSINSICHTWGERPFVTQGPRGQRLVARRHLHGRVAGTTCTTPTRPAARHGVDKGQLDTSARLIWLLREARLGARRALAQGRSGSPRAAPPERPTALAVAAVVTDRRGRPARPGPHDRQGAPRAAPRRRARSCSPSAGFDGTAVEEIAARAGVSKPVVYEHFGGKEGLYAVVVDREVAAPARRVHRRAVRRPPARAARAGRLALLTYVEEQTDGFRILVRESPVGMERSGRFATIISDVASQVEHILAAAVQGPRLRHQARRRSTPRRWSAWSR